MVFAGIPPLLRLLLDLGSLVVARILPQPIFFSKNRRRYSESTKMHVAKFGNCRVARAPCLMGYTDVV